MAPFQKIGIVLACAALLVVLYEVFGWRLDTVFLVLLVLILLALLYYRNRHDEEFGPPRKAQN